MWNPFKKRPTNLWELIQERFKKQSVSRGGITIYIALIGLIVSILGFIVFTTTTTHDDETPSGSAVIGEQDVVSGEKLPLTYSGEIENPIKPQGLCITHPDFFIFHYELDNTNTSTGALYSQIHTIQELAEQGGIVLMSPEKLSESIQGKCFPGNPIWILGESGGTHEILQLITEEYQIPLFSNVSSRSLSLSGYTVNELTIRNETKGDFFRETLQKYLELESGGIFKDVR